MVCLFLLPVIAKITTDCLILIGCWKVSLNLIGCLKKLSCRTKCSTLLDLGSSGLYAGAYKKFVPFFWTHFIFWQSVNILLIYNWRFQQNDTRLCWASFCLWKHSGHRHSQKESLIIKSRVGDQTWQIGLQMFGRNGDGMKAALDNQEIEVEFGVKYSLEE